MKKKLKICMIIIGMMVSSAVEAQSKVFVPCIEEKETETVDTISSIEPEEVVSIHICERDYYSTLESLFKGHVDKWVKKSPKSITAEDITAVYGVTHIPNNEDTTFLYYLDRSEYYLSKTRPVFEDNDTLVLQPAETVLLSQPAPQPATKRKRPCDSPGMKGVSKNGGNHSFF